MSNTGFIGNDERWRPTHLDLFSGIGGFALAAQWAGFRTVAFCEIDKYCQRVLAKNFGAQIVADAGRNGGRENVAGRRAEERVTTLGCGETVADAAQQSEREPADPRIFANIFDLDGSAYRGCSLLTGGFPCQPFSVAGKRRGASDDRALWPEMLRVIGEARPAFVLAENVPGLIPMELDNVLSSLERIGYACRTLVIPACAVDARHRRDRVWIVGRNMGDPSVEGLQGHWYFEKSDQEGRKNKGGYIGPTSGGGSMVNADSAGCEYAGEMQTQRWQHGEMEPDHRAAGGASRWLSEPDVGRVAHGIPSRVDRLKGLGNAIVPQVAFEILREIRRLI